MAPTRKTHEGVTPVAAIVALVVLGAFSAAWPRGALSSTRLDAASGASIVASNKYTERYGHAGVAYPWFETGKLAEPHRTTRLQFADAFDDGSAPAWSIEAVGGGAEAGAVTTVSAASAVAADAYFAAVGTYRVASKLGTATLADEVVVRYVRREIRSLDAEDRGAFFDAIRVLATTTDGPGRARYGHKWRGLDHYVAIHLANAVPNLHEDRFHDGMGFVSHGARKGGLPRTSTLRV